MPGTAIFTPGPIHHFVRFRNSPTALYLGTSVYAPEPENEKFKLPVFNDLGGRSVPFQLVQDGENWLVTSTLNRFDLTVCRGLRNLEGGPVNPVLGTESKLARGTLVLGVSDFELVLLNLYAGTVSSGQGVGSGDLNIGRRFFSCNLRKYKESTQGTRTLEVALAIECLPLFNPVTGGFSTYVEGDVSVLGALGQTT